MPADGSDFTSALHEFAESLTQNFSLYIAVQPEDQLKGPVQELLKAAGVALSRDVGARIETHA